MAGVDSVIYGVKVIHTHTVGKEDERVYEELILRVNADSFDEAYIKAEQYMQDAVCDYTNIYGENVKTLRIEAVDCFQVCDPEGDVQELFSSFKQNNTSLSEQEFYNILTASWEDSDQCSIRDRGDT